jgi:rRNA-processing protein FCF1
MKILLDTNFILTCVKERIDFKEKVQDMLDEDIEWIVPQQVLNELGNLKDRKEIKRSDRDAAGLSFQILKELNPKIIDLGKNPNIDISIVNYILDKNIVLATLDKELKKRLKENNKVLTIRSKNYFEIS